MGRKSFFLPRHGAFERSHNADQSTKWLPQTEIIYQNLRWQTCLQNWHYKINHFRWLERNATLNKNKIDKWGGLPWKETTYRSSIIDLTEELDLLDIYGQFHADTKSFTYETKNSKLKSRIDFFLISRPISRNVKRTEVRSSIAPDHKAIFFRYGVTNWA